LRQKTRSVRKNYIRKTKKDKKQETRNKKKGTLFYRTGEGATAREDILVGWIEEGDLGIDWIENGKKDNHHSYNVEGNGQFASILTATTVLASVAFVANRMWKGIAPFLFRKGTNLVKHRLLAMA
jgi:hypothetical protein